jgi:hypothetical protein
MSRLLIFPAGRFRSGVQRVIFPKTEMNVADFDKMENPISY